MAAQQPTRAYTGKVLTEQTINQQLVKAQYAVRGRIPQRAEAIRQDLLAGKPYPFKQTVACNIGNPQVRPHPTAGFISPALFTRPLPTRVPTAPVRDPGRRSRSTRSP